MCGPCQRRRPVVVPMMGPYLKQSRVPCRTKRKIIFFPKPSGDLQAVFSRYTTKWKNVDYVGAWLVKAAEYNAHCQAPFAFVATNSLCQGQQVPITWAVLRDLGFRIRFAYRSFIWSNLAKNRAGVTVIIVGLDANRAGNRILFQISGIDFTA